jgi:trk system potassium uptake protein TrkA
MMSWELPRKAAKRIAVFGMGRFGCGLAVRLAEHGADVLAIDSDSDIIEEMDQRVSRAVCLDATSEFALKKLDLDSIALAIVCIGRNISAGLLVTAALQRVGVEEIWVRAIDQNQARILEAMGVSRIISLENEMARQVAQEIAMPAAQIIAPLTANHSLAEVKAKPEFIGKTLQELDFRNQYGLNIVAIKSYEVTTDDNGREKGEVQVNDLPHAEDVIEEGDVLLVIGNDERIADLQADLT